MIKYILIFVVVVSLLTIVNGKINVISYDMPGTYQLSPKDYGYAEEIIVELWGAGGGGDGCICAGGGGGGGGAYIKALVKTDQQIFNMLIGKGGYGGSGSYGYCKYGSNGNSTSLIGKKINLTAGGWFYSKCKFTK